ncbi:MAG: capsule assembly Wzi family protein [Bacillota bacterium]|nr:capsule assembly Wzi family protein [Bacillota bacterium]
MSRGWVRAAGVVIAATAWGLWAGMGAPALAGESLIAGEEPVSVTVTWHTAPPEGRVAVRLDPQGVYLTEGYLAGEPAGWRLVAGKQRVRWGPGKVGALILSDEGSFWGLLAERGWSVWGRDVKTAQLVAPLNPDQNRVFFAHRLESEVRPGLTVGISETAMASGDFTPWLYNPIPVWPYFLTQHLVWKSAGGSAQDYDINCNLAVDARYRLASGAEVYGEFYADDAQSGIEDRARVPDMVGVLLGVSGWEPSFLPGWSATVEYAALANWVYSHKNLLNNYVWEDGTPIGHWLGPDADALTVQVAREVAPGVERVVRLQHQRHGEGEIGESWRPEYGKDGWFLSGVVETRYGVGVAERRRLSEKTTLKAGIEWLYRVNAGNQPGVREGAVNLKAELSLTL